ncbi:MAG: choice-of-anchor J domain-containing protein [Verrucomicrobiales bacterium]
MKAYPILFILVVGLATLPSLPAQPTADLEEMYNLDEIRALEVTPDGEDSVTLRRIDGSTEESCPLTLIIEIEGEVEANGNTSGYFDEVSLEAASTTEIAFAGDTGPGFDENGDPLPFEGKEKSASIQVEVTVGDTITLRYETRNSYWNEGWGAKVVSVEVVPPECTQQSCSNGDGSPGSGEPYSKRPGSSYSFEQSPMGDPSYGGLETDFKRSPELMGSPASLKLVSAAYGYTKAEEALADGQMPAMLALNTAGQLYHDGDVIRQVITASTFVDIVPDASGQAYEIRYYHGADRGALLPSGLYSVESGANAHRTWRIEVTPGTDPELPEIVRFIETSGGVTRTTEYLNEGGPDDWTVIRGTGPDRRIEKTTTSVDGIHTTETFQVFGFDEADNQVLVHQESETHSELPVGRRLTQRTLGAGADLRTTTYDYWPDTASPERAGRLQRLTHPSGRWEYFHQYDGSGRVTQKVEQYLGNAYTGTWPDTQNRMIENLHASGAVSIKEPFSSSIGNFTVHKALEDGHQWSHKTAGGGYMEANGFAAAGPSETWLISPTVDLSGTENPLLRFETSRNFIGPTLQIMVSTDYQDGDPNDPEVSWSPLTTNLSTGNRVWRASGPIYLPAASQVTVAFLYTSEGGAAFQAAEWRVRNVEITGDTVIRSERQVWLQGQLMERSWSEHMNPFDARDTFGPALPDSVKRHSVANDVTIEDPWAASNRVTTRFYYPKDAQEPGRPNQLRKVQHADGQIELHTYHATSQGGVIHRQYQGLPDGPESDNVSHGFLTEREEDQTGREIRLERFYLSPEADPLLIEFSQTLATDDFGRPTTIVYGDGTLSARTYACCGLQSEVTRDGLTQVYIRDEHGRVTRTETWSDSTFLGAREEQFDARGRLLSRTRIGADDSAITETRLAYRTNGELLSERDALDRLIEHQIEHQTAGGYTERRQTLPDNSTLYARVTRSYPDGRLHEELGAQVLPARTTYSLETDPEYSGNFLLAETTTLLDEQGQLTGETTTTLSRPGGLLRITRRPSAAPGGGTVESRTQLDLAGRTLSSSDFDGVITRYEHPTPWSTVQYLDADQSGSLSPSDQARRSTRTYLQEHGTTVERSTIEELDESGQFQLISSNDREVLDDNQNGLETWSLHHQALTTTLQTLPLRNGTRTTIGPDQTGQRQVFQHGRLHTSERLDTSGNASRTVTYVYDAFGRLQEQTDSINGTSTYTYDALDRLTSQTLPDPDPADASTDAQTTSTDYTLLSTGGERQTTTHPGNATSTSDFDPLGRLILRYGHDTYPQAWTYDHAGRPLTLTTWQEFDASTGTGQAGAATTQWIYNAAGLLQQKLDATNTGPSYTYTAGGRLATKTLAREDPDPVVITYHYAQSAQGNAGHSMRLLGISYSDQTPEVNYTYNNRGQVTHIQDGTGQRNLTYHADRLVSERHGPGLLQNYRVETTLDPTAGYRVTERRVGTTATRHREAMAYDNFGRLQTLTTTHSQGPQNSTQTAAAYQYHHDTSLVTQLIHSAEGNPVATQSYDYDRYHRQNQVDASVDGTPLHQAILRRDQHGRVREMALANQEDWQYNYDTMGQLTTATKRDTPSEDALPGGAFEYAFDSIGNRLSAQQGVSASDAYTANANNEISEVSFAGLHPIRGQAHPDAEVTLNGNPVSSFNGKFFDELTGENSVEAFTLRGVLEEAGHNLSDAVA